MGFYEGNEFLRYIAEHDRSKTRWNNLETGAFVFCNPDEPHRQCTACNLKAILHVVEVHPVHPVSGFWG
jgi:hypothetical protein